MFLSLSAAAVFAAPAQDEGARQPLSITADQMDAKDGDKIVIFSGNVVAKQKDVVINCDLMRVYYKDAPGSSASEEDLGERQVSLDRVEAEGNVKITRGENVAMAHKAVYRAAASPRTIVLTGEPRIWRDKDFLTGVKITYYLDQDRSVVEGGGDQRVNAIFYQGHNRKNPKNPATDDGNNDGQ